MHQLIVLHLLTTLVLLSALALVVLVQTALKAVSRSRVPRPDRDRAGLASGSPRTA